MLIIQLCIQLVNGKKVRTNEQVYYIGVLYDAGSAGSSWVLVGMRLYYYFKTDNKHWLKENYDITGKLIWTETTELSRAFRVSNQWIIKHLIHEELLDWEYKIETRDWRQNLVTVEDALAYETGYEFMQQ